MRLPRRGAIVNHNEHCGWFNFETWCVNLWMSNDAGSDEYYREIAQETHNTAQEETRSDGSILFTRDEVATRNLAERLKEDHEERQEEYSSQAVGVFADLLSAALSEVNWHEIAQHYVADVDKESEAA
jgi:predicted oxidoreductase (fatty acid repression mutant protein)